MQEFNLPDGSKTVAFNGECLGSASSAKTGKLRWFELDIYRTEAGSYVIHGVGRSDYEDENDRSWVKVCGSATGCVEGLHQVDADDIRYLTRVSRQALEEACQLDRDLASEFQLQRIR